MKKYIKSNRKKILLLVSVFIFFLVIGYLLPYTNDDWAWASDTGIERFLNRFEDYNGRYFGNIFILIITRYRVLKALSMAVILTLLTYFVGNIDKKNNELLLLLSSLFMVLVPQPIFRQAIAWASGFTNYVPPILLVVLWIYINKNLFKNQKVDIAPFWSFASLILGISTCLFMEHVSLYALATAIFIIVYQIYKKIKPNISHFTYLLGVIIGNYIMFSNGAYHHVAQGDDFYRSGPKNNIIIEAVKKYVNVIYNNLVLNNTVLLIIIAFCMLLLFYKYIYKNENFKRKKIAVYSLIVIEFYALYSLIHQFFPNWETLNILLKLLECSLTGIYCICLLTYILLLPKNVEKNKLCFYLISMIIMTGPLLIVNPVTPRCFYPMYILFCCFTITLLSNCFVIYEFKDNIIIKLFVKGTLLITMFYTGVIAFSTYNVSNKLEKHMDKEFEKGTILIELPKIPYEDYLKHPNPHNKTNLKRFKKYYHVPPNVELKFISYSKWNKKYDK